MTIDAGRGGPGDILVGRDTELAALLTAVEEHRTPVVVVGPSGSGKSRLLDELVSAVTTRSAHATVVSCCAVPTDVDIPFGIVTRLLTAMPHGESSPSPELTTTSVEAPQPLPPRVSGGPDDRFRRFDALLDELSRRCATQPSIFVLDDAQWADSGSLGVLYAAVEASPDASIQLVVGARPPDDPNDPLGRLITRAHSTSRSIELRPLSSPAVALLAEQRVGRRPGPQLLHALDSAQGNPLMVCELVDAAVRSRSMVEVESHTNGDRPFDVDLSDNGSAQLADQASTVLVSRLFDVGEAARELIRTASVLESSFELTEVAAILGVPAGSLVSPCAELLDAELLLNDGNRLAFRHDLVRTAIYRDLPEWARTALHRQAAARLADDGADAVAVARHLDRADPSPSNAVWFERAGQGLLRTDPAAASALLEEACRLQPQPTDGLILAHVQSLAWTNRASEAEQTATSHLAASESPAERPLLHFALAQSLTPQGRLAEAATSMFRAGNALVEAGDLPRGQQAVAESAIHQAMAFQHDEAIARSTALIEDETIDPIAHVIALSARSWANKTVGRIDDAVRDARAAVDASGDDVNALRGNPHLFLADALLTGEHYDEFEPFAVTARSMAARFGSVWSLPGISAMATGMHLRRGDWDKAVAESDAGLSWARDTGNRMAMPWLLSLQSVALLWRGDDVDAEALIAEADDLVGGEARTGAEAVLWARAWWADVHGDDAATLANLRTLWELVVALDVRSRMSTIGPELVRAAIRSEERDLAIDVTRELRGLDDQVRSNRAARDACGALVDGDLDLIDTSAQHYESIGLRPERALVLVDGARIAAHLDDQARALDFAQRANALHDELGAHGLARRLDRLVPGLSAQTTAEPEDVSAASSRNDDPLAALSPAELRIAELVSAGHNNPEIAELLFISRRTVESHLSHVYTKLGIRSRVDLAVLSSSNQ